MSRQYISLPDEAKQELDPFKQDAATSEELLYEDFIVYSTKVPNHNCSLPEAQEIINDYIYSGSCVVFRRKFRKCLMVNAEDPESKARLKSSASINEEEQRHLKNFYHTIHPFSSARVAWETIMIFVYFASFIIVGMQVVVHCYTPLWIFYLECTLFVPLAIDIILWFLTGYFDEDTQVVVLEYQKIRRRYLLSYFFSDVISALPLNSFIFYFYPGMEHRFDWVLNVINMISRLPRIITVDRYMKKTFKRYKVKPFFQNTITLGITLVMMINWAASLLFAFKCYRFKILVFLRSYLVVVKRFMLVGVGANALEIHYLVLELCYLMIGCLLSKFIIIKVTAVYSSRVSSEQEYWNLIRQMNEYMRYRLLPRHLKKKVFQFINFKFRRNVYNEDLILDTLSETLKKEIVLHNCRNLVERVNFFRGIPLAIISRISSKLKSEIYLPNDVIIQAGAIGHVMYFIHTGTVAVYTSTGKEICHLTDGSHFGEISLVVKEPRSATVIAIAECAVFRLSRKDFKEAIAPFPELETKIKREAMARMEKTLRIMGLTEGEINLKRGQWLNSDVQLLGNENN